jgi:DNA invertase Pin-like site-specific DNA recombinase
VTTATRPRPPHGTEARYQGGRNRPGCRCQKCVTAWTKAGQRRMLAHLAGRPPKIPPAKVTAHLQTLIAAGMSLSAIARAADVSRDTVTEHARGAHPFIRRSRAVRILAVRPEHADPNSLIPALGSRRRTQALYAAGYGAYTIARHTGITARAIDYILIGARTTVTIATRNAIAEAYRQLAPHPAKNSRTQRRAAAEGWPGPDYWDDDDFDNPDFEPAAEATPRYIELAENGLELEQQGHTREQAAARLGVTKANLQAAIGRYRKVLEAAA